MPKDNPAAYFKKGKLSEMIGKKKPDGPADIAIGRRRGVRGAEMRKRAAQSRGAVGIAGAVTGQKPSGVAGSVKGLVGTDEKKRQGRKRAAGARMGGPKLVGTARRTITGDEGVQRRAVGTLGNLINLKK